MRAIVLRDQSVQSQRQRRCEVCNRPIYKRDRCTVLVLLTIDGRFREVTVQAQCCACAPT